MLVRIVWGYRFYGPAATPWHLAGAYYRPTASYITPHLPLRSLGYASFATLPKVGGKWGVRGEGPAGAGSPPGLDSEN